MRQILKQQELPYHHADCKWMFDPEADIAVAITPAAKAIYNDYAYELLAILRDLAKRHDGLDQLQIFMSADPNVPDLWVQEAEDAIVFLLTAVQNCSAGRWSRRLNFAAHRCVSPEESRRWRR